MEVLVVSKGVRRKDKRGTWHGQQDSQTETSDVSLDFCRWWMDLEGPEMA